MSRLHWAPICVKRSRASSSHASLGRPSVMPAQQTESLQVQFRVGQPCPCPLPLLTRNPDDRPTASCFRLAVSHRSQSSVPHPSHIAIGSGGKGESFMNCSPANRKDWKPRYRDSTHTAYVPGTITDAHTHTSCGKTSGDTHTHTHMCVCVCVCCSSKFTPRKDVVEDSI